MCEDIFPWEDYDYRFRVEIHLSLCAKNGVVMRAGEDSLPFLLLKSESKGSHEAAKRLFKAMTGTDGNWLPIQQVSTLDNVKEDTIIILYSVFIPERVPLLLQQIEWVDYSALFTKPVTGTLVHLASRFRMENFR